MYGTQVVKRDPSPPPAFQPPSLQVPRPRSQPKKTKAAGCETHLHRKKNRKNGIIQYNFSKASQPINIYIHLHMIIKNNYTYLSNHNVFFSNTCALARFKNGNCQLGRFLLTNQLPKNGGWWVLNSIFLQIS